MKFIVRVQQQVFQVEISGRAPDYDLVVDGRPLRVNATSLGDESLLTMLLDNHSTLAHTRIADVRRGLYDVSIGGKYRRLEVLDELASATVSQSGAGKGGRVALQAPMPGVVIGVHVQPGEKVQVGTPLIVMEAMKMQNELASEIAGTVIEVHASLHQAVESGYELVVIEAES